MVLPPWHAEIVDLHAFFTGWLGGTVPETDAVYARFVDTMHPAFTIIGPDGTLTAGDALRAQLRAAHGSRPGWTIWIRDAALRYAGGGLTIATYEEWQRHADGLVTARLSTAVFSEQPSAPNGLAWLHVHETWLPGVISPQRTQSAQRRVQ